MKKSILYGTIGMLVLVTGWAADFPQWRGTQRDGRIAEFEAPLTWPEKLTQKWRIEVGEGHSSPVLVGDTIYQHARQGEQEVVLAIDLATGETRWRTQVETAYEMHESALDHGKGPKSTPVVAGQRLFTFGISGVLSAFQVEDGKLLWRRSFEDEFPATSPLFGVALSPLVVDDKVIAHVGAHDNGALRAFSASDGSTLWSWVGDGPGYSSPMLVELNGVRQVVTQTQDMIVSLRLDDGQLLWSQPFSTNYYQNSVTPVLVGETLVFSGLDKGVFAVKPVLQDGKWTAETIWSNSRAAFYMNTPVLVDGMLFGLSHKRRGQFVCLDAASGDQKWGSRGREGENAAVLATSRHLFLVTTDAELIVAEVNPDEYRPIAQYSVSDTPTWAHPLVHGKTLLIKDLEHLTRWDIQ